MNPYPDEDWDLSAVIRSSSKNPTSDSNEKLCKLEEDVTINPSGDTTDSLFQQNANYLMDSSESYDGLYEVYDRFLKFKKNPRQEVINHEEPVVTLRSGNDQKKRKKKIERMTDEVHVEDDTWKWQKSCQKRLKQASHYKTYYKCNNVGTSCPAKKRVEKIFDEESRENKFKVTYVGEHDRPPPSTIIKPHILESRNSTGLVPVPPPAEVELSASTPCSAPTTPSSSAEESHSCRDSDQKEFMMEEEYDYLLEIFPELREEENPSLLIDLINPN